MVVLGMMVVCFECCYVSEKFCMVYVGVGGMGNFDLNFIVFYGGVEVFVFCDVDFVWFVEVGVKYVNVKRYFDFCIMFDELGD